MPSSPRRIPTWSALTPANKRVVIPSSLRNKSSEVWYPQSPLILEITLRGSFTTVEMDGIPIFVDPEICPRSFAFQILVLKGPVKLGISGVAHEHPAESSRKFGAKSPTPVLHKTTNKRGRDRLELMLC